MLKKTQYYASRLYSEQLPRSEKYDALPHAKSMLIANFKIFDDDEPHHRFYLYDEINKVRFQDSIQIDILEVPKAKNKEQSRRLDWLHFLSANTKEEFEVLAKKIRLLT
jgi:predicted transposase/invertase (TIGR01784 family)